MGLWQACLFTFASSIIACEWTVYDAGLLGPCGRVIVALWGPIAPLWALVQTASAPEVPPAAASPAKREFVAAGYLPDHRMGTVNYWKTLAKSLTDVALLCAGALERVLERGKQAALPTHALASFLARSAATRNARNTQHTTPPARRT